MPENKTKIVLTGGHAATTALGFIQKLQKDNQYKIHWIGSTRPVEGKRLTNIEEDVFPKLGVICHYITSGRIQRKLTRYTIPSLFKIPVGIISAFWLILQIRPRAVVSFGGYAGFPVVFAAFVLGIPVILHEQTVAVGLANKVSAYLVNKIAISTNESLKFFPKKKTVLTGNPTMENILKVKPKNNIHKTPIVFITGGSRGSQIINQNVEQILPRLLDKYEVIHQTGQLDFEHFKQVKKTIKNATNYQIYSTISPLEMSGYYQKADIYVGRSGANTVSEIVLTKTPAVFIPIPWTRYDEQTKNATKAAQLGIAVVLPQDNLSPDSLLGSINSLVLNWKKMVTKSGEGDYSLNRSAAANLVNLLHQLI